MNDDPGHVVERTLLQMTPAQSGEDLFPLSAGDHIDEGIVSNEGLGEVGVLRNGWPAQHDQRVREPLAHGPCRLETGRDIPEKTGKADHGHVLQLRGEFRRVAGTPEDDLRQIERIGNDVVDQQPRIELARRQRQQIDAGAGAELNNIDSLPRHASPSHPSISVPPRIAAPAAPAACNDSRCPPGDPVLRMVSQGSSSAVRPGRTGQIGAASSASCLQ